MKISDFKAQYPAYQDMSDQELADALHEKFYSDIPKDQFYKDVGLEVGIIGKATAAIGNAAGAVKDAVFGGEQSVMDGYVPPEPTAPAREDLGMLSQAGWDKIKQQEQEEPLDPRLWDVPNNGMITSAQVKAAREAQQGRETLARVSSDAKVDQVRQQQEQQLQDSMYTADNLAGNFVANVRNTTNSVLKIGPTAAKGIFDIFRLTSGDTLGQPASEYMANAMKTMDEVIASESFNAQNAGFKRVMTDPNADVGDMFAYLIDNPQVLADAGITTIGSMYLPAGAANMAAKGATAAGLGMLGTGRAATGAAIGTTMAQNAADTFTSDELKDASLADRYKGASVAAAMTLLMGIATGGGAEGAIARKMAGDLQGGRVSLATVKDFLKAVGKEAAQESGEEIGGVAGEFVASKTAPDFNNVAKRVAFAGTLGAAMGAGTHFTFGEGASQNGVTNPNIEPPRERPAPSLSDIGAATTLDDAIRAANAYVDNAGKTAAPDPLAEGQPLDVGGPGWRFGQQGYVPPAVAPEDAQARIQQAAENAKVWAFGDNKQSDLFREPLPNGMLYADPKQVTETIERSQEEKSQAARMQILDGLLETEGAANLNEKQLARAFSRALEQAGYNAPKPTDIELQRIARITGTSAALAEMDKPLPSAPNELVDAVPEKKPRPAVTDPTDRIKAMLGAGWTLQGKQLVKGSEKVNLSRPDMLAARALLRKEDADWTAFPPETGTLGIPRAEMPQIKAEHRGAMVNFLNARGISHEQIEINGADLKPTQAEFSLSKVEGAKQYQGGDRSILISSDGHVLDGHHQWLAKYDSGLPIKAIRLNAPIADLLPVVKEFPSSTLDGASEAAPAAPARRDRRTGGQRARDTLQAENPFVAFLAKHGVRPEDRSDSGVERGRRGNPLIPGYGPIFRRTGLRLDELASAAREAGFLTQSDIDSDEDNGGVNKLLDMIRRALDAREVIQRAGMLDVERKSKADEDLLAEAARLGIDISQDINAVYDAVMAEHAKMEDAREAIGAASIEEQEEIDDIVDAMPDELQAFIDAAWDAPIQTGEITDEELDRIFGVASRGRNEEGSAASAGQGSEGNQAPAGGEGFDLEQYSREEVVANQEAERTRAKAIEDERRKLDAQKKKEDEQKDIDARMDASAENFQLGQSAEDALAGQGDIFSQPAPEEATPLQKEIERAKGEKHENATAPEHIAGVDDRELSEIVDEFNEAQARMFEGGHPVTNIFAAPKKDEVVRLGNKVKVYHKDHGWMTPAEAKAKIQEWKDHAAAQYDDPKTRSANSDKIVLSLFDLTGKWSQPWEEAGYQVYRFDIQDEGTYYDEETGEEKKIGDINNMSVEFFADLFGDFNGNDVYAVLAATPCTDFASSGARHFAAKDADGRTVASVKLVHQTLNVIEYYKPAIWAIENPVGRIEKLGGLPPWRLSFDPNHLGDPYTKKTLLWGRFNADLPIAPVDPVEGSKMWAKYGGKSQATKNARSATPEGFSYGFFMANNAADHPAMAIANKFDRLDRALIEKAVAAGITPKQIESAVEDFYYMNMGDEAANEAIRALLPEDGPKSGKPADDLDAMFDELLAEETSGIKGEKAKLQRQRKPKAIDAEKVKLEQQRKPRTAGQAAASAAKNTAVGFAAAVQGLGELFGGTIDPTAKIVPDFDQTKYEKAKPYFQAAIASFSEAAADIKDVMRAVIKSVLEQFGPEVTANMKPYVVRFIADYQDGKLNEGESNVDGSSGSSERDRADRQDGESHIEENLFDVGPAADRGTRNAGKGTGKGGRGSRRGTGVSDGNAADGGAQSDRGASGQEPGPAGSTAGTEQSAGSGSTGRAGSDADGRADGAAGSAAGTRLSVEQKRELQRQAESIPVKAGDLGNIRETLPFLLEGQQSDVHFAETRFSDPTKQPGVMFTNGTGTGKTFTGLGIAKRFERMGKGNGIIIVPNNEIAEDWITSGKNLGLNIKALESTSDNGGAGMVVTTYANFGDNPSLIERDWDFVMPDEAHYMMASKDGKATRALATLRALTRHPDGFYSYSRMKNRDIFEKLEKLKTKGGLQDEKPLWAELKAREEKQREQYDAIAKNPQDRPKTVFLSATPFAYVKAIDYAEGYLFEFDREQTGSGYNSGDGRERFYMQHFGYRMRYNKLTRPDGAVDEGLMARQFNSWLKAEGALSGRILDVEADYDRKFVTVNSALGRKIDEGMEFIEEGEDGYFMPLAEAFRKQFDYLTRRYLLEAIKATEALPVIREHLAKNRKVVIIHDYKKGRAFNPFARMELLFNSSDPVYVSGYKHGTDADEYGSHVDLQQLYKEFAARRPDLIKLQFPTQAALDILKGAFPNALIHNGDIPGKQLKANKRLFNADNLDHPVIILQADKGREGISLHDTIGKHQRVEINLGMPSKPTALIQLEGRIYRVGQITDAIFRYFNTGTRWERWTFADTIAERADTAEALAMGDLARGLRDSIIEAFEDSDAHPVTDEDGKGGKARDRANASIITEWDRAKSFYFGQGKKTSKNKAAEGKDYFATPEPVGLKMVEFADIRNGEDVMEPSAGHGAIARWFPHTVNKTVVEPSGELVSRVRLVMEGHTRFLQSRFEDVDIVNKYDAIVMNPPFGLGGSDSTKHLEKAYRHLRDGGRIVALLPRGPAADKKFDNFLYGDKAPKDLYLVANYDMPSVTFERAGTGVMTRIVVLDKVSDPAKAPQGQIDRDLTSIEDINELFDTLKDRTIPGRTMPRNTGIDIAIEEAKPAAAGAAEDAGKPQRRANLEAAADATGAERFYATFDFPHTKTGATMYGAAVLNTLPREAYDAVNKVAKANGGWYSSYQGGGAKRGFLFKSAEARAKFMEQAGAIEEVSAGHDAQNAALEDDGFRLDLPLSDQSYNVRKALRGEIKRLRAEAWQVADGLADPDKADERITGQQLLDRITERLGNLNDAIDYLRALGVEDIRAGDAMYSVAEVGQPVFFSALAAAIPDMKKIAAKDGTVNAEQARLWLQARQKEGKFKADELAWTGLEDWLKTQPGRVAIADIEAYLQNNGVRVEEVMKGETDLHVDGDLFVAQNFNPVTGEPDGWAIFKEGDDDDPVGGGFDNETQANDALRRMVADNPTKYSQYTLPGGENYRELLLTLPEKKVEGEPYHVVRDKYMLPAIARVIKEEDARTVEDRIRRYAVGAQEDDLIDTAERYLDRLRDAGETDAVDRYMNSFNVNAAQRQSDKNNYRSSHWDEANIVAHIRFNERTDADGNKVLFIEEIQSDWAQEGKKKGFREPFNDRIPEITSERLTVRELIEREGAAGQEWVDGRNAMREDLGDDPLTMDTPLVALFEDGKRVRLTDSMRKTPEQAAEDLRKRWQAQRSFEAREHAQKNIDRLQPAPFVTDTKAWVSLAIKRMIRYAAENGFDKIAFVNGQQSADRYDLSKQVQSIGVTKTPGGNYSVMIEPMNGAMFEKTVMSPAELADMIGKELADKTVEKLDKDPDGEAYFEGDGLKVGGEGMKAFYDRIVPQVANDVLKRLGGGKVGEVALPSESAYDKFDGIQNGAVVWTFDSRYAAERWAAAEPNRSFRPASNDALKQPGFDITPALREKALDGLPLFSKAVNETRRKMILAAVAAAAAPTAAKAGVTVGKAKAIDPAVLTQRMPAAIEKILRDGQASGTTSLNGGKALKQALNAIALTGPKELRAIAGQIAKLMPSDGVWLTVDDNRRMNVHGVVQLSPVVHMTLFTAEGRTGLTYETFIHEAMHVAVAARYRTISMGVVRDNDSVLGLTAPQAAAALEQFKNVWQEFRDATKDENLGRSTTLGLAVSEARANPDEFFVRSLTDPLLQAYMANKRYEGKTLWQRFKDWVKTSLFGFKEEGTAPSWLDAALIASGELAEAMGSDRADWSRMAAVSKAQASQRSAMPDEMESKMPEWLENEPQATQEAARKAGIWTPQKPLLQRLKDVLARIRGELVQGIFDQFEPLAKLDYHAYVLSRLSKSSDAPLEAMLMYGKPGLNSAGAIDVNTQGGGLIELLQQLQGEHDRFFGWIAGNRAFDLKAQGRENLFTDTDISALRSLNQGTMPDGSSRAQLYRRVHQEFNAFSKAILDIAEKADIINAADRAIWEKDFYVPFYRVLADEKEGNKGPKTVSGLVNQYAFKKLKGGEDTLNDLMHNTLQNWSHLLSASLKNQAAKAAIEAAYIMGIADHVPVSQKGSVFYLEQGKAQHYIIHDPLVFDAVAALEWSGWNNPMMKAMQKAKHYLTLGVTISPEFKIANLMRDSLAAVGLNPISGNIVKNLYQGWGGTNRKSSQYASMLAGGGLMRFGTFLEGDRAEHAKRLIDEGVAPGTILNNPAKVKDLFADAWDWWQEVGDRSENITRAAIYRQVHDQAIAEGKTADEAHLMASFAGRDSMDFSLQGKYGTVRFLSQLVPFLNARLQGLYKMGREGIAPTGRMIAPALFGPAKVGDKKRAMRFGAVVGAVSLASIALFLAYADDDDWKQREEWDRDAYWWFKVGGIAYRIPKPFEIGALGTVAERGLEAIMSGLDKESRSLFVKRMMSMIGSTFAMNPTPQLVKPALEIWANENSFTGRPIETPGMEKLSKAERTTPYTSATAQLLGNAMLSPAQIDHLVQGYFGWLGTHAVMTADFAVRPLMGLPEKPTRRWPSDYFVVGRFARTLPEEQSKYLTKFYEQAKDVQEAMADIRHFQSIGLQDKVKAIREDKKDVLQLADRYTETAKEIAELNKEIKLTQYRKMDPDAKRDRIDKLTAKRNALAKRVEESRLRQQQRNR